MSNHLIDHAVAPVLLHLIKLREKKLLSDEVTKLIMNNLYGAVF